MTDTSVPDTSLTKRRTARRAGAREAIVCVLLARRARAARGPSVRSAGEEMNRGVARAVVLAVGRAGRAGSPTGSRWRTPWRTPDQLAVARRRPRHGAGGFAAASAGTPRARAAGDARRVRPRRARRASPRGRAPLRTLLVTGDSMSQPLDAELARDLAGRDGVKRHPRPAPRHGHLEDRPARLGQALRRAGQQGPARRRGDVHRRERGLPDEAPAGRRRSAAAARGRRSTRSARGR